MELKPEHKPRQETTMEWLARTHKEKYGDEVKTQYRVEEHLGSYDQDDNYIRGRARRVDQSEWFDTKEEAEDLMSKSTTSSNMYGAFLKIGTRTLYRKWIPPREGYWQETWL